MGSMPRKQTYHNDKVCRLAVSTLKAMVKPYGQDQTGFNTVEPLYKRDDVHKL